MSTKAMHGMLLYRLQMKLHNHQLSYFQSLRGLFCKQNVLTPEFAVIVVILVVVFLRFYRLGQVPVSGYWDETAMLVDLKAILATGHDMHGLPWYQAIFPSYGDYKLPVYIWLSILSAKVFDVSLFSLRLVSAVTGILTMVVAGLLAKTLTQSIALPQKLRRLIFLSTVLVTATAPWSFLFSRTAFESHVSQLCIAVSVYVLLKGRQKIWPGAVAGLFGALAMYGYYASRFIWFPLWVGSTLLVLSQTSRHLWKKPIASAIIGLSLCLLLLVPLVTSDWYQPMQQFRLSANSILQTTAAAVEINQWREWSGNTILSRVIFHRDWFFLRALLSNYADHMTLQTLFLQGDNNLRHSTTQHGLFLWPMVLSLLIGVVFLLKKVRVLVFLTFWWLLALLPASVPLDTPHALRSLNGLVPLSIMMGIGTGVILFLFYSRSLVKRSMSIVFLLCIYAATFSFTFYYFTIYPVASADAWQGGFTDQVMSLVENRRETEPVWILVPDERFYLYLMAYGPYQGDEFVSWPEEGFKKTHGDRIFFLRNQKDVFVSEVRKHGSGLVMLDDSEDTEVMKQELEAESVLCQSFSPTQWRIKMYRVCRVIPN